MRFTLIAAASALGLGACTTVADTGAEAPAGPTVSADAIEAHIRFLADDAMEGREAGARGYDLAANYVEAQYRAIGLAPGGETGYRAEVPLQTMSAVPEAAALEIDGEAMTPGEHFIVSASAVHDESDITAPAVFVGQGIVAPSLGINAYEGVDVSGKIVVMLAGAPDGLASDVAAHLGSARTRAQFAADAGAIGMVTIPAEGLTRWHFERQVAFSGRPAMTTAAADSGAGLQAQAAISNTAAEALFANAPQGFQAVLDAALNGEPVESFELNTRCASPRRHRGRWCLTTMWSAFCPEPILGSPMSWSWSPRTWTISAFAAWRRPRTASATGRWITRLEPRS